MPFSWHPGTCLCLSVRPRASQGQQQAASGLSLGTATPEEQHGLPMGRGGSGTFGPTASCLGAPSTDLQSISAPTSAIAPARKALSPVPTTDAQQGRGEGSWAASRKKGWVRCQAPAVPRPLPHPMPQHRAEGRYRLHSLSTDRGAP